MFEIQIQMRSSGNWCKVGQRTEITTVEAAQTEYAKYSTPSSDWGYARLLKDGEVIQTNENINFWKK